MGVFLDTNHRDHRDVLWSRGEWRYIRLYHVISTQNEDANKHTPGLSLEKDVSTGEMGSAAVQIIQAIQVWKFNKQPRWERKVEEIFPGSLKPPN